MGKDSVRMLFTGAGGFVGSRMSAYYERPQPDGMTVLAKGFTHKDMDICDVEAVRAVFYRERPQIVIHTAAISNTTTCEDEPQLSQRVNVEGVRNLAECCKECGAKLIFFSSDQVYNGSSGQNPHKEDEALMPQNVYGRDKLEAEKICRTVCPDSVVLRLTWMYDYPSSQFQKNGGILLNILGAMEKGMPILGAVHEYRGLTYVWEVIGNLYKLFELPGGIYNYGSTNDCCTYEVIQYAVQLLRGSPDMVRADEERFRDNPRNLSMDTGKAVLAGIVFSDTKAGICRSHQIHRRCTGLHGNGESHENAF